MNGGGVSPPPPPQPAPRHRTVLVYGGKRFFAGQPICIHSQRSNQHFSGVIVRVDLHPDRATAKRPGNNNNNGGGGEPIGDSGGQRSVAVPGAGGGEVLARLADGTYARLGLAHLKTGRLTIKPSDHLTLAANATDDDEY